MRSDDAILVVLLNVKSLIGINRRAVLFVLAPILLCSCQIWGTVMLATVHIPAPPAQWEVLFDIKYYEVHWISPQEKRQQKIVAGDRPPLSIALFRGAQTPIIAIPITASGVRLPAAGALAPLHVNDDGQLSLNWRDGCASSLLLRIFGTANGFVNFNVERFLEEVWQRTDGRPWYLDESRIVENLPHGKMRADYVRVRPSFPVEVAAVAGWWVAVDPFAPPIEAHLEQVPDNSESGMVGMMATPGNNATVRYLLRFQELPTGMHRYIHQDGLLRLDIFVEDDGAVVSSLSPLVRR